MILEPVNTLIADLLAQSRLVRPDVSSQEVIALVTSFVDVQQVELER